MGRLLRLMEWVVHASCGGASATVVASVAVEIQIYTKWFHHQLGVMTRLLVDG